MNTHTIVRYPSRLEESQESVIEELQHLARLLQDLLPDPALSPLERIERLARVIPDSIQASEHHLTARTKLNRIRCRLAELVPDVSLSSTEKIQFLVTQTHALVPHTTSRLFEKLEKIRDCRLQDNGSIPFPGWTLDHRYWPHLDLTDQKGETHVPHSSSN